MLLGSGELSRELALAFQRLGADVIAVDRYADAPAHGVADRAAVVKMNDAEELTALIEKENPRYVVAEAGVIAADALIAVAERGDIEVFPTPRSTRLSIDREGLRRLAADELGLPTAPFWFAGSVEELTAVAEHAGFPLVVKPIAAAPGDGESVLLRVEDVEPAWHRAMAAGRIPHNRVMAETVVEVDFEVTLLTVRTTGPAGPAVYFCEPIGHRQADGDVLESWQPQQMSPAALDAAKSIAARIVNSLGGRGVFGVELLVRGDEVYFADVRPRPYDSGLVTLRSQRLSQFELHARAILGLAVDTIMISPAAAEVSYAGAESTGVRRRRHARGRRGAGRRRERCAAVRPARRDRRQATAGGGAGDGTRPDRRAGPGPTGVGGAAQTLVTDPEDDSATDRPTMAPFLGALAIIVLVVIAIGLFNIFGNDDPPEDQQVGRAAVGQNDALQRQNYADFRSYTCRDQQGVEADILARQRDSVAKRGERFVDDVTDVVIDGDRATAKVTYHFGKAPDTKTGVAMTFVREDGAWKVCSTGPS